MKKILQCQIDALKKYNAKRKPVCHAKTTNIDFINKFKSTLKEVGMTEIEYLNKSIPLMIEKFKKQLDDIKNEYEQIQKNSIKNDFEGIMFYSTGIVPPVGNKIDILSATLCELKETIHEYYRSKFGFNN